MKKYKFSKSIKAKLGNFEASLHKRKLSESTIRQKTNHAGYFLQWLEKEEIARQQVEYRNILAFIDYCKENGMSINQTNRILQAIKEYFNNMKLNNNPAENIKLRGIHRKEIQNIIDYKELEGIYKAYPNSNIRAKRNKSILGILIYQGVTTEELHKLESINIDLKKGIIRIPSTKRSNSRRLELKPTQILQLHEYITEIKPKISKGEEQLFTSTTGNRNIKPTLLHLFREIKKTSPKIKNAKQIRASAIVYWLKHHNLREVQYMAGHKYVSSTERYQVGQIDELQKKVEEFHPLK